MEKFSLDELIGEVKPVAEVELGGKIYPIVPPDSLPQKDYLRMQQALLLQLKAIEELDKYQQEVISTNVNTVDSDGNQLQELLENTPIKSEFIGNVLTPLYEFQRLYLEAVMRLPENSLSEHPAPAISACFNFVKRVMDSFKTETKPDENAPPPLASKTDPKSRRKSLPTT